MGKSVSDRRAIEFPIGGLSFLSYGTVRKGL